MARETAEQITFIFTEIIIFCGFNSLAMIQYEASIAGDRLHQRLYIFINRID